MLKAYLDRATEIIGERTSSEIRHDDEVVEALNQGYTIQEALAIAVINHPDEAIKFDDSNIDDIRAHYKYLQEHKKIMKMIQKQKKK